jgi:ABC-type lipoprotein export system ATPase subunit
MVGSARHLFARGNTARGVHSLYQSAFQGLSKVFLLTGYPGTGKSTLLQRLADWAMIQGQAVELFHSPLNPEELDGLIIKDLKVGLADERLCEGLDAIEGVERVRIDLGQAVDLQRLSAVAKQEIDALHPAIRAAYTRAYEAFATALRTHDEWEAIYIAQMDFAKADQVGAELIDSLFGDQPRPKAAAVRHLFFGAATPKGAVDHIPTLTAHLERRILIKGRPGSGKSTLLKRLARAAEQNGVDVEVFHCGFDPNSLDMLIFPELSLAIFDSTAPHEYFPSLPGDEILDMYELAIQAGTDEQYAHELQPIKQRYDAKMQEAIAHLKEAQLLHARLKAHYVACTDFTKVDLIADQLREELERLAAQSTR